MGEGEGGKEGRREFHKANVLKCYNLGNLSEGVYDNFLYYPSNLSVCLKLGRNKKLKKNVPRLDNFTSKSLP